MRENSNDAVPLEGTHSVMTHNTHLSSSTCTGHGGIRWAQAQQEQRKRRQLLRARADEVVLLDIEKVFMIVLLQ